MSRYRGCPPSSGSLIPAEHVPRFELALVVLGSRAAEIRTHHRRNHVNNRVHMDDARAPVDIPDGIAACDGRPDELPLQFRAPTLREGREPADFAGGPREKRDLVDWRVEGQPFRMTLDEPGDFCGESGEPLRKIGAENVDFVGYTVVQQRPEDLHAVALGRHDHRRNDEKSNVPFRSMRCHRTASRTVRIPTVFSSS